MLDLLDGQRDRMTALVGACTPALRLVVNRWRAVTTVTAALAENEVLTYDEVCSLVQTYSPRSPHDGEVATRSRWSER